jgi:small subunit ribosomal protein S9
MNMSEEKKQTIKKTAVKKPDKKTDAKSENKVAEKIVIKEPVSDKEPKKEIKEEVPVSESVSEIEIKGAKNNKYFEEVGKRKTAKARVRLFTRGEKAFIINDKPCKEYFPTLDLQKIASASLDKMKLLDRFRIQAIVRGGGTRAQAEAVRHAIAKILVQVNPIFRKRLKKHGFLTRDSRMRERKKFGLKRARRAPQWKKR